MKGNKLKKVLLVMLLFVCACVTTGCGNKKAITSDDYKSKMESKGYTVQDATSQFSNYEYVKKATIALEKNGSYQIEFYELSDKDNAVSFFNNNKTNFENSKSSGASETSISMGNYDKYAVSTNGQYKVVSRIDNTVVYLDVSKQYKADVQKVLKDLGY